MKRFFAVPRASVTLRRDFAALGRTRSRITRCLDAGAMSGAREAVALFCRQACALREALARCVPETSAPPETLDAASLLDGDDAWLRLTLPDRLHAVLLWLGERRRSAYAALGEGRRQALRLAVGTLVLVLVCGLAAWGRALWRAREVRLAKLARSTFVADLIAAPEALPPHFKVAGLLSVERGDGHVWRWGVGPRTVVAFVLETPRTVRLTLRLSNPVPDQVLTIAANSEKSTLSLPQARPWMARQDAFSLQFPGVEGLNAIVID